VGVGRREDGCKAFPKGLLPDLATWESPITSSIPQRPHEFALYLDQEVHTLAN
jgi:hypothetical protein